MFGIALILVLLVAAHTSTYNQVLAEETSQKAVVYSGYSCDGRRFDMERKFPFFHEWNDMGNSYTFAGVWIFYQHVSYNEGNEGSLEYGFSADSPEKVPCRKFNYHLRGKVSSARYVGNISNYRTNSLTWYEETKFQGEEEFTFSDLPRVEFTRHKSLIVTGASSWTLYDQTHYRGHSICLFPNNASGNYHPHFVSDMRAYSNVPYNFIRSVRMGCSDEIGNTSSVHHY